MIARGLVATGAAIPVVASGVNEGAMMATSQPLLWDLLGYQVEAASLIAAIFGCLCARYWIGAGQAARKQHRWSLDLPVSGMALAVSVVLMIKLRPEPLTGLLLGGGAGVLGEGIFKIAENRMRAFGLLGGDPPPGAAPIIPD